MLKIFIFIVLVFLSVSGLAATRSEVAMPMPKTSLHTNVANINQGNFEVGGSVNLGYNPRLGDVASILSPSFRYFFADRFSAGLATEASFGSGYTSFGAGPSFAFYFLRTGRWAFFLGEDILWQRVITTNYDGGGDSQTNTRDNGQSISKLGANLFVTPDVAVGPSLTYTHLLGEGEGSNVSYLNLIGQFSVYF